MAASLYAWWIDKYRDEPSQQTFWRTDIGGRLWPVRPPSCSLRPNLSDLLMSEATDPAFTSRIAMEEWCAERAVALVKRHGLVVEEDGRRKLFRAVAAAMQRASLRLAAAARGELIDDCERTAALPIVRPAITSLTAQSRDTAQAGSLPAPLSALIEAWWNEAERTGKSASTHASYAHAVRLLAAFLKHEDAHRITKQDIVRFKDHRLASRKRNGEPVSATTVKNSDLAGLKSVFG